MTPKEIVVATLEGQGYTDKHVREHWTGDCSKRRWFATDGPIVEIVTANNYMRVTAMPDDQFEVREYESNEYVERPKTEFFIDPFRAPKVLDLSQLLVLIATLWTIKQQKAA